MNQAEVIARLQTIFDTVFLEPVVLTPAISAKDVPECGAGSYTASLTGTLKK